MISTIFIILVLIIALPFLIALFIKKEYLIQREIVINKPVPEVFDYIRRLRNQDNYSKWVMIDPNMKKTFKGTDGTVGFVYSWDSENKQAGKGEQEIMQIEDNQRLDVQVRFERPFKSTANTPFTTEAVSPGQTRVVWGMTGVNPYPKNIINLFMEKMLGPDLELSLSNLKGILENS